MRFYKHFAFSVIILLAFAHSAFAQFDIPKLPPKAQQSSVYDYAQLLSGEQKRSLEQKLLNYADSTSTQIVIAIVPTIKGENIGTLTPKWGHEWGIGQEKEDNGMFILLALQEREIWISPGYGLEHILTAGINGEIIRNDILPYFRKGDYYGGLQSGTDALIELFAGTYQNNQTYAQEDFGWGSFFILLIFVIVFLIIMSKLGKGGGKGGGYRRDWGGPIILSGGGRSSWSGGSSWGGGGFGGGFGGGGFSGGGAGGSW